MQIYISFLQRPSLSFSMSGISIERSAVDWPADLNGDILWR